MHKTTNVEELPTNNKDKVLKAQVYYDIGGPNFFSGGTNKRGYYLSTKVVTRQGNMESFIPTESFKLLLEETTRFSQKRIIEITAEVKSNEHYSNMIASTLAKSKLTLVI